MTINIRIEEISQIDKDIYDLLLLGDSSQEMLNDYINRSQKHVAKISEEIVGIIVIINTRPKTLEIVNIAVREEFQNKGIGKQLIKFVINMARAGKNEILAIGTGNCGIKQIALYQKCGFRIVGVELDFYKHYFEEFYENGILCRDMIRMKMYL